MAFGDPYVLYDAANKLFYIYGTGGGAKDGFGTYSSKDLVNWKSEGQVFRGNTDKSWDVKNFWAPELYHIRDKYYLFYSADWRHNPNYEEENFRIGVAVADKPTGPFRHLSDKPILVTRS